MKRANKVLTPAIFAIGAVAQSAGSFPILGSTTIITNPSDTGVVYETYSICPSGEVTTITGPTSYYCPGPYCNGGPTMAPSSTVWVTELIDICPTATNEAGWLTTMTTTITEACPCSEGMHTSGYVPSGYTTAVATCTVCGDNSPVATIVTPVATAGAYAAATAGANAGAGAGSGSNAEASAAAGAGANAGSGSGSGSGGPGSGSGSGSGAPGSGSNAQASAAAAAAASAGAGAGSGSPAGGAAAPGSSNAAEYGPAGTGTGAGAGSNSTFSPPLSPSAGSGAGGSASGISPPFAVQSHSAAAGRSGLDVVGTFLLGVAGLVATLAWQL